LHPTITDALSHANPTIFFIGIVNYGCPRGSRSK